MLGGYAFDNSEAKSIYINTEGIVELTTTSMKAYPFINNRTLVVHSTN